MAKASVMPPTPVRTVAAAPKARPAPLPRLTQERLAEENARTDRILAGLTVLLAFLLASFPVFQFDAFRFLSTGRSIVQGEFRFGADPFTYTQHPPQGLSWVHQLLAAVGVEQHELQWVHTSWLFDVVVYGIYSLGGGAALALFRGLIVAALALMLLQIRRPGASLFPSAASIALAITVLSPRLFLRPELVSFLFLGFTLYLLWHPPVDWRLPRWTRQRLWLFLPPLFALWANLDAWFLLGPVAVGLYLLGEFLQDRLGGLQPRPGTLTRPEQSTLLFVLLAGVAACVVNPFHLHVFQLPAEFGTEAFAAMLAREPGLARLVASPFGSDYFTLTGTLWYRPKGLSLAEWCYYPLVLAGIVSFVLNWRQTRGWRVLIWLAFLALSAWQARLSGFFAVVAGPITALNIQDWLVAGQVKAQAPRRSQVVLGQVGRLLLLLAMLLLGALMVVRLPDFSAQQQEQAIVPGLIHPRGALGWSLYESAPLRDGAQRLTRWREEGALPGRAFAIPLNPPASARAINSPASPGFAEYAAWFGRSEEPPAFLDTRYKLHGTAIHDFLDAYQAIRERSFKPAAECSPRWQRVFAKPEYDISHLVITGGWIVPQPDKKPANLVEALLGDRDASGQPIWELIGYPDGRFFVLAWTGSRHWPVIQKLRFDPEREAFRAPSPDRLPPEHGPERKGTESRLVRWLSGKGYQRPAGVGEAEWFHLQYGNARERRSLEERKRLVPQCVLNSASVVSLSALGGIPHIWFPTERPVSEASLLLSLRASRRALAEEPDQPDPYFPLYLLYDELRMQEIGLIGVINPVRDMQVLACLREFALLQPDDVNPEIKMTAVMNLARLYLERDQIDLVQEQFEQFMTASRKLKPPSGVSRDQYESQLQEQWSRVLNVSMPKVDKAIQDGKAKFSAAALSSGNPLNAVVEARRYGLSMVAREELERILQQADPMGPIYTGAFQQLLDVYLDIGAVPEARALLARPDAIDRLGPLQYHDSAALAAAAYGDYAGAIAHRRQQAEMLRATTARPPLEGLHQQVLVGDLGLPENVMTGVLQGRAAARQRAELLCQAGLLALEAGRVDEAAELFRWAIQDLDTENVYRPLAERHYFAITGRKFEKK